MLETRFALPNLCRNTSVLRIVVLTQLFAIVICVLVSTDQFWLKLGLVSLYLQWVALMSTALLCVFRRRLNKAEIWLRYGFAVLICFACFFTTELLSQGLLLPGSMDWGRVLKHALIALIVIFVAFQILALVSALDSRRRIETEARVQALQSRIKPHFLFNSLNTIAELTATAPTKAEESINALSMLFRAGLESDQSFHSLASELNLCERYLSLERWRLGEQLNIEWNVDVKNPPAYDVPKLILQPLIENAVVHGRLDDGSVHLLVDIRESRKDLSIVVENQTAKNTVNKAGHGIGRENIRERLMVLYDDQQTFRVREEANRYRVLIRFPKRRPKINN